MMKKKEKQLVQINPMYSYPRESSCKAEPFIALRAIGLVVTFILGTLHTN
jgi:hypothetical protein